MTIKQKGFTLIEVLCVIIIMSILLTIAVPMISNIIEKIKEEVCISNSLKLEKLYNEHLDLKGIAHTDNTFTQYMQQIFNEICPLDGEIIYRDGKVNCSVHTKDQKNDREDGWDQGDIPYL